MTFVVAPCGTECPILRGHAWNPWSRLSMLSTSPFQGPDIYLQSVPVLSPARPLDHCQERRPLKLASGEPQSKINQLIMCHLKHRASLKHRLIFFMKLQYSLFKCSFTSVLPRERCFSAAGWLCFLGTVLFLIHLFRFTLLTDEMS